MGFLSVTLSLASIKTAKLVQFLTPAGLDQVLTTRLRTR